MDVQDLHLLKVRAVQRIGCYKKIYNRTTPLHAVLKESINPIYCFFTNLFCAVNQVASIDFS